MNYGPASDQRHADTVHFLPLNICRYNTIHIILSLFSFKFFGNNEIKFGFYGWILLSLPQAVDQYSSVQSWPQQPPQGHLSRVFYDFILRPYNLVVNFEFP